MQNLPQHKKIILFDGLCNLCDASVQFLIQHDTRDAFRFVSLQSNLGKSILKELKIDTLKTDSIILYEPIHKMVCIKSDAVFEIIKVLGGIFWLLLVFKLIPSVITDKVYDWVAKNRYHWLGKKESCWLPNAAIKSKFLE